MFDPADSNTYTVTKPHSTARWMSVLTPTPLGMVLYALIPLLIGVVAMLVLSHC